MYAQQKKPKENKSRTVANSVVQKKSNVKQGLGFVDNRTETYLQRHINAKVNNNSAQHQSIRENENNTSLPDNKKAGMKNLLEISLNDVEVNRGFDKPVQLVAKQDMKDVLGIYDPKKSALPPVLNRLWDRLKDIQGIESMTAVQASQLLLEQDAQKKQAPKEKKISAIDQHLGDFNKKFQESDSSSGEIIQIVREIAINTPGIGQNFTCDEFARHFQENLKLKGIKFQSLLIAVDVAPDPKNETGIFLNEHGHKYEGQQVGNDSHFVTTIEEDGLIWVFDNHHPNGILISNFLSGLEFRANLKGEGEIKHATLVNKGLIKVFIMPAMIASKAGGWLKALSEQNPKFHKFFGTLMRDFISEYGYMKLETFLKAINKLNVWGNEKIPDDNRYDSTDLSNNQILAMVYQALIEGRKWAVNLVLQQNFDGLAVIAKVREFNMHFVVADSKVYYKLRGG